MHCVIVLLGRSVKLGLSLGSSGTKMEGKVCKFGFWFSKLEY